MVNPWITHVRSFANQYGMTYGCALSDPRCKASYRSAPVAAPMVNPRKKLSARASVANRYGAPNPEPDIDFGVGPDDYEDDQGLPPGLQMALASVQKKARVRKPRTPTPPTPSPRKKKGQMSAIMMQDYDVEIPKKKTPQKRGVASREALDNFKAQHFNMTPTQWRAYQKKMQARAESAPGYEEWDRSMKKGPQTPKKGTGRINATNYVQPSNLQYFYSQCDSSSDED